MTNVLVIREFDDFSRILTESGYTVINCPTISTIPHEDLRDLATKLENINDYNGIFLTSATAAKILVDKLDELKINLPCKIYVLGKRGHNLLEKRKLKTVYFPAANTASEMLENIALEDLCGKKFLFVRGEKSLRVVPDFVSKIAAIDETIVYRTEKITVSPYKISKIGELSKNRLIKCAVFFSPSGAESFIEQFGATILHQTFIAAIGKTTAEYFERRNRNVDFVSSKSNAKNFATELIDFLENRM